MGEYGSSASDVRAEFIWLNPQVGDSGMFGGDDGPGGYMPIALATAGGTLNWVHSDHLGTPIVITDATGIAIPQPGGYTTPAFPGQSRTLHDLYYNRYRDYDPSTGRYIQADPIGLAGGQSPYSYAMGNPLNYDDPEGLQVRIMPPPLMARPRGPNGRFIPMTPTPGRMSPNYRPGEFFAGPPGFTVMPQDLMSARNLCPPAGENIFTRYGRQAHNNYRDALGYDYIYNQPLPSGRRPDAIDYNRRIVRELKPDNPRAMRRGERQLQDYLRELREMTEEAWEGIIDVYRAPW